MAISTPAYFAREYFQMELHERNPQINDPNEAKTFGTHDPIINLDPTKADAAFFEEFGLYGAENVKGLTFVGNKRVSRHPQCFIFSCAKGFFPDLKSALTAPPANYDACVKISRPNELWRKLMEAGRVGGRPFAEIFWPPIYRPVKYESLY